MCSLWPHTIYKNKDCKITWKEYVTWRKGERWNTKLLQRAIYKCKNYTVKMSYTEVQMSIPTKEASPCKCSMHVLSSIIIITQLKKPITKNGFKELKQRKKLIQLCCPMGSIMTSSLKTKWFCCICWNVWTSSSPPTCIAVLTCPRTLTVPHADSIVFHYMSGRLVFPTHNFLILFTLTGPYTVWTLFALFPFEIIHTWCYPKIRGI